ncbi:ImpA family metalloprotease [Shewanella sp. GutDb-MelDb]|uniref:ImpA family metalloprotease n=1 Tax=Shewanella sp. GutDb-MelDb TaxID=2058316 RepID=UPI000C7E16E2|nr:ImpA family metalloprotease [Shewanella sp. GutDb-MelDb]PKG55934.1 hypothetical protein CXF82_17410 [Shewanella sp. GutDb-MelDb]
MKYWLLSSCIVLGLSACGGAEDSDPIDNGSGTTPPPTVLAPEVELGDPITAWNDKHLSVTADVTVHATGNASFVWSQTAGPEIQLINGEINGVVLDASNLSQDGKITLSLSVTDSSHQTTIDTVDILLNDKISAAMQTGDASISVGLEPEIVKRGLEHITHYRQEGAELLQSIYLNDAVLYDQGRHSQMIQLSGAEHAYPQTKAFALVTGNKGLTFAATSDKAGQRNAAFGTDIISSLQQGNNAQFEPSFKRLLGWMLAQDQTQLATAKQVRLFLMNGSTVNRITDWVSNQYPDWQVSTCSDEATLGSCLSEAQLVISGSAELFSIDTVAPLIAQIQSAKQPLLYMHLHSWNSVPLTQTVLNPMGFSMQGPGGPGNYFAQDKADWSSVNAMLKDHSALQSEQLWLSLFDSGNIDFTLANCASSCDDNFSNDYQSALKQIKQNIQAFDSAKQDIFGLSDHKLYKLLTLLGDGYRHSIQYPMDVSSTDNLNYLKAYYADHSVYHFREFNLLPNDLGNFSRTDFSHITAVDMNVAINSKKGFRSAGVYALPGQTVKVTRTDNSKVRTWVFINTQRSGSTHEFAVNGYNRPKYLQSSRIEVKAGETIKLTSPYGGPLQVQFDQTDLAVALAFEHIGQHPYWRKGKNSEKFMQDLAAEQYDWAELATEHFEVHSRLDKMQKTMSHEPLWDTPEKMEIAIMTQVHNYPHLLAGFKGPFIDEVAEISNFAASQGWEIDSIDTVKHMNADQPTCGSGCSGNPYDASWSFSPTGHGDIHELGHGLEKGRLRFDGHEGHASTNPYSYYSKSRAYTELGKLPSCQGLNIDDEFAVLQASVNQPDPFVYMQDAKLTSWSNGMATMLQMMVAAQKHAALENGWHLLARLHILLREFERAKGSDELWQQKRSQLGFSQFSLEAAKTITNNDFLMIAMSYSTKLDYRDMYQMWGLATTQAAKDQLALLGYPMIEKQVYVYAPGDYCLSLDLQSIPVDGQQAWPL